MTFREIIKENCEKHSPVNWWPRFAYHCTDIRNAVSILNYSCIYSRLNAMQLDIMQNDNASRQVIDLTNLSTLSSVRFYFRPKTPTQYYNEGFKHPQLRYYNDEHANMPVPVFFLFDLEKLLSQPNVKFSEKSQAGVGSILYEGAEAFSKMDFDKIYGTDLATIQKEKSYRHAEILYPNEFWIDTCLCYIICRNEIEKTSLINLLKTRNPTNFTKYKHLIKTCKENMFENNGLFVTSCAYSSGNAVIKLSDTLNKKKYTESLMHRNNLNHLDPITLNFKLEWRNQNCLVTQTETQIRIDYENTKSVTFTTVPEYDNASFLRMIVFLEDDLMCFVDQPLNDYEVIR